MGAQPRGQKRLLRGPDSGKRKEELGALAAKGWPWSLSRDFPPQAAGRCWRAFSGGVRAQLCF